MKVDKTFYNEFDKREYEPFSTQIVRQRIRPGAVMLDIGANAGYYSLLAAKAVGSTGKVYAFEPSKRAFGLLKDNIERNGYGAIVEPINKAVSDKNGTVQIYTYKEASGASSINANVEATLFNVEGTEEVSCIVVDDFLAGKLVDFIKIDIEGHELAAIAGMKETIQHSPNLMLLSEVNPALLRSAGTSAQEYIDTLQHFGLKVQVLDEAGLLEPLSEKHWAIINKLERETADHVNILCSRN